MSFHDYLRMIIPGFVAMIYVVRGGHNENINQYMFR